MRLDIWLWAARFFKTRSLAKQAIEGGKIDVDGEPAKPAKTVHEGHRLRIRRGDERLEVTVVALSSMRGPAPVAQALYEETPESRATRERDREMRRLTGAGLAHPQGRPDKHARRQIRELKEGLE
ncbi:RNA-binding S4 domain-containing protein [Dokdonella sp. MW10]|uniref:RNA-binding S4 domain-containing protein n=1 Tax=Dokdonella sp. MW10 TaxID=2992926 RepID=UPI003F820455